MDFFQPGLSLAAPKLLRRGTDFPLIGWVAGAVGMEGRVRRLRLHCCRALSRLNDAAEPATAGTRFANAGEEVDTGDARIAFEAGGWCWCCCVPRMLGAEWRTTAPLPLYMYIVLLRGAMPFIDANSLYINCYILCMNAFKMVHPKLSCRQIDFSWASQKKKK